MSLAALCHYAWYKDDTIDHIIESIHVLRSRFDNDIHFLLDGDLNRIKIDRILDSYGALRQVISVPTRKQAVLENVITDLHTLYHPPTTLAPLQVDEGAKGKDSDHNVVIMAPLRNKKYEQKRNKKIVKTRPLPNSNIEKFGKVITLHKWDEVFDEVDVHQKTANFQQTIRNMLEDHFPEKSMKISVAGLGTPIATEQMSEIFYWCELAKM